MRRTQAPLCVVAVDVSSYWNFGGVNFGDSVADGDNYLAAGKYSVVFDGFGAAVDRGVERARFPP